MVAKNYSLTEFSQGMDTRQGTLSKEQNRFRELTNAYITVGKKVKRRPPSREWNGILDSQCQGLILKNGAWYTIAPKGATIANTGEVLANVTVLYFDVPDYCSETEWELVAWEVYEGNIHAVIRHDYASTAVPTRLFLHVFDNLPKRPTFLEDPSSPADWGPAGFPLNAYGTSVVGAGAWKSYDPVLWVTSEKLWMSRVDGNAAFSAIARGRVWDSRDAPTIEKQGQQYYFVIPAGAGPFTFHVSELFADLSADREWAGYVLEYMDANGAWQKFTEDLGAPTLDLHYQPITASPSWLAGSIALVVKYASAEGKLIRFRMLLRPEVELVAGAGFAMLPKSEDFLGDDTATSFPTTIPYADFAAHWTVFVNGALEPASYYSLANVGGNTTIQFPDVQFTVVAGVLNDFQTSIPYAEAGDADFGYMKVYANGVLVTVGVAFSDVGGFTKVTFTPDRTIGDVIQFRMIPPVGIAVAARANQVLIGSGKVTYEGAVVEVPAQLITLVGSPGDYLIGANGGAPAVVGVWPDPAVPSMPLNGLERYRTLLLYRVHVSAGGGIDKVDAYQYGSTAGAENQWFLDKHQANLDVWSGVNEASFINPATHNNTGRNISSVSVVKNRIAIHYPEQTQLWAVDPDPTLCSFIDSYAFGTEDQSCLFFNRPMILSQRGFCWFDLTGLNFQALQDVNIGEPVQYVGSFRVHACAFWPRLQLYVAAVTLTGADKYAAQVHLRPESILNNSSLFGFIFLSFSQESGVAAWSFNPVKDVTANTFFHRSLVAVADRLYYQDGTKVRFFDASATVFRDSTEDQQNGDLPYKTAADWHHNQLGKPGVLKRLLAFDIIQRGKMNLSFQVNPNQAALSWSDIPVVGITHGSSRNPLAMTANSIAVRMESQDETGWELEGMDLDFLYLGR